MTNFASDYLEDLRCGRAVHPSRDLWSVRDPAHDVDRCRTSFRYVNMEEDGYNGRVTPEESNEPITATVRVSQ